MACPHVSGIAALIVSEIRRSRFHPRSGMGASDQTHQGDRALQPVLFEQTRIGAGRCIHGPGRRPGNSPGKSTPARMQPDSRGYGPLPGPYRPMRTTVRRITTCSTGIPFRWKTLTPIIRPQVPNRPLFPGRGTCNPENRCRIP